MLRQRFGNVLPAVIVAVSILASLVATQFAGLSPAQAGCSTSSSQSGVFTTCSYSSGGGGSSTPAAAPQGAYKPTSGGGGGGGAPLWSFEAEKGIGVCADTPDGKTQYYYTFKLVKNGSAPPGASPPPTPPQTGCQPEAAPPPPPPPPPPSISIEELAARARAQLEPSAPGIWTDFTGKRFLTNAEAFFQATNVAGGRLDTINEGGFSGEISLTRTGLIWDFGDGRSGSGGFTTHTYQNAGDGDVTVTLTATWVVGGSVTDPGGNLYSVPSGPPITKIATLDKGLVQVIAARTSR